MKTTELSEATPALEKLQLTEKHLRRFWKRVNKNGPIHPHDPSKGPCWEWNKSPCERYGRMKVFGIPDAAHRISYQIHHRMLGPNECALHSCDNPPCVNPDHLWAGTAVENNRDRDAKGRQNRVDCRKTVPKGITCHLSKLREEDVIEIRELGRMGLTQREIGIRFSITRPAVGYILRRRNWKHI